MKKKEEEQIFRRNGKNFRLFKPEEDIPCPICTLGKLNKQNRIGWECSVCCRWFDEVE